MARDRAPPQRIWGMGLGGLILREVASHNQKESSGGSKRLTVPTKAKLKACKERRNTTTLDPRATDHRSRCKAAIAIAALSVSWAPNAGIAKGFSPKSREALEIAGIKQAEWTEYEPKRLWRARSAWTSWTRFANARGYPGRDAPSNLVIVWLNSSGSHTQAANLYRHMRFMVVQAAAPLNLTENMRPMTVATSNPAERKQAAVAEPVMLQYLERRVHAYAQRRD